MLLFGVIATASALLYFITPDFQYKWQWFRVWRYIGKFTEQGFVAGPLLQGLILSLKLIIVSLFMAIIFGLGAGFLGLLPSWLGQSIRAVYVGLIRNTPLLLHLFIMYFLLSPVLQLSPFMTAALTLALFEGAYFAEIFRAGFLSVSRVQWEGGLSLGFGEFTTFRLLIFPQALRTSLAPLSSQTISLIKDSSLVSAIAVADLTMQAQALVADTFMVFEIWLLIALVYLFLSLLVSLPALWLERKLQTRFGV